MITIQFRTSKGICEGIVNHDDTITLDDHSTQIIRKLYSIDSIYIKEGWVQIEFEDSTYGGAEYYPQTFTPEEVSESRKDFEFQSKDEIQALIKARYDEIKAQLREQRGTNA